MSAPFTAPTPDPKMVKLDAELVERFVETAKFLTRYDTVWEAASPAAQPLHSVEKCAERASEILCKNIVVPTFTKEEHGLGFMMLRRSAECSARRRYDVVLFAPA